MYSYVSSVRYFEGLFVYSFFNKALIIDDGYSFIRFYPLNSMLISILFREFPQSRLYATGLKLYDGCASKILEGGKFQVN